MYLRWRKIKIYFYDACITLLCHHDREHHLFSTAEITLLYFHFRLPKKRKFQLKFYLDDWRHRSLGRLKWSLKEGNNFYCDLTWTKITKTSTHSCHNRVLIKILETKFPPNFICTKLTEGGKWWLWTLSIMQFKHEKSLLYFSWVTW
jgi:hypothetical protein